MKQLVGIVGTNSRKSTNRQLLEFIKKQWGGEIEIELIEIKDIPLFNKPEDRVIPTLIKEIAKKIEASDGVIISTPEYDHAIPAVLINALNWLSYGIFPFVDKPVMITGASYGTLGSSRAQSHLKQILDSPELRARIMPGSEFLLGHSLQAFDSAGNLINAEQVERLAILFKEFIKFIDVTDLVSESSDFNKKEAAAFSWEAQ